MGVFEDTYEELKKAKPPEKALIIGGALAIVGVALYLHSKSSSAQPFQAATPASSGQQSGAQSGGWGTVGPNQTPILPGGYCPQYDPNGNLVDYAPCGTTPTPTPGPKPPGPPKPPPGPPKPGNCPPGVFCTSYGPPHVRPPKPQGNPPPKPVARRLGVIQGGSHPIAYQQATHVATSYARRASAPAPAWQPPRASIPIPPPNWQPPRVGTAGIPPIQYPVGKPTRIS